MGRLITALKWFAYGIALGLLFAPRSGKETREQIIQWATGYVSGALNAGSQAVDDATTRTRQAADRATGAAQRAAEDVAGRARQASDRLDQRGATVQEAPTSSDQTLSGGPV